MVVDGGAQSLKAVLWIGFIFVQIVFVAAGLVIIFGVINTWYEGRKLDSIFEAGIGAYAFLLAWRVIRRWVLDHIAEIRRLAGENVDDTPTNIPVV